ncbi:MAG: DUF1640 domain-containing protein [Rhodoferax sp.]|nr:DUF1640 domain-containing protein [Rhodoferax sp.]
MGTITFDTLKFANTLKAAGVPDKQAEAQATAQRDSFAEAFDSSVATKTDIARLDANVKADIARLEAASKADAALLRSEMQAMEMRLTIKLGAFLAVAVGVMLTVLKMH